MEKMKYIITLGLTVVLLFASCEDFLTEDPKMQQSSELTLSTFEGLDNAIFGAYAPLASVNWYGHHLYSMPSYVVVMVIVM